MTQPTVKLTYFDTPTSRGEECRLALHLAGVPFVDDRVQRADWPSRKAAAPFGALPVLEVEGHPPVAQTNTILRLIGRRYGLHPQEEWEAARHESLMAAVEDLRSRLGPVARLRDPEEKKRAREDLARGYLQEWGGCVERQLGEGPFVGGAKPSMVDVKLFVALDAFARGSVDHIPADVFKDFPKLTRVHAAVKAHPKIVEWYAR
jgi:glutathione S-transferase